METGKARKGSDIPLGMVVLSIVSIIIWALFILFYALFWSTNFSLFQNIIVTIVSLTVTGLVLGLIWVVWESRRNRHSA